MQKENNPDSAFMARALELAGRGRYTTHPNPRVGCVIVREQTIVGEGWHERAGEAHAEIRALEQAGDRGRGATAYVTLEPCCHQGRTPPCTRSLIQAGIRRVVVAMPDPNPAVAGGGIRALEEAGVKTTLGTEETAALALNPGFVCRMQRGRPLVRLKLAMSLDGRSAMASGESRWITHEPAREDVHRQRAAAGAVMVGVDTVLADDPRLNVRLEGAWRQPDRVILDTRARTPLHAQMLRQPGRTFIVTAQPGGEQAQRLTRAGAVMIGAPVHAGRLELQAALSALGDAEINALLVEAGPRLAGALMQAGLVDEVLLYVAPNLLGDDARGIMQLPGMERLSQRIRLRFLSVEQIGPDLRLHLAPETGSNRVQ